MEHDMLRTIVAQATSGGAGKVPASLARLSLKPAWSAGSRKSGSSVKMQKQTLMYGFPLTRQCEQYGVTLAWVLLWWTSCNIRYPITSLSCVNFRQWGKKKVVELFQSNTEDPEMQWVILMCKSAFSERREIKNWEGELGPNPHPTPSTHLNCICRLWASTNYATIGVFFVVFFGWIIYLVDLRGLQSFRSY